jgi:hypothetical protein
VSASGSVRPGNPFTEGDVHIKGIESFWSYTGRRLARLNGVKRNFDLHLKECEWRLGNDPTTIYAELRLLMVQSLNKSPGDPIGRDAASTDMRTLPNHIDCCEMEFIARDFTDVQAPQFAVCAKSNEDRSAGQIELG